MATKKLSFSHQTSLLPGVESPEVVKTALQIVKGIEDVNITADAMTGTASIDVSYNDLQTTRDKVRAELEKYFDL